MGAEDSRGSRLNLPVVFIVFDVHQSSTAGKGFKLPRPFEGAVASRRDGRRPGRRRASTAPPPIPDQGALAVV